jgi:hypothetical protein
MTFPTPGTPSNEMAPSTLAQWFGALGTLLAVLVALFKDPFLAWRRKPQLDAKCTKDSPWTVRTEIIVYDKNAGNILWTGGCYYVRIEVGNSGQTRAEKVQVYASKLAKLAADGKFEDIQAFIPLNMRWANSPPTAASAVLDGISPKMGAFCDIVSLSNPANPYQGRPTGTQPNVTVGQLQLEVEPTNRSHLLAPGKYRLTLRIAAANVKPVDKVFQFMHTGRWLQDDVEMRRDCLGVSLE